MAWRFTRARSAKKGMCWPSAQFSLSISASFLNISIEHIAVPSPDPARLAHWYQHVLGAREVFNSGSQPPTCLMALPDGGYFEIYAADLPQETPPNNKRAGFRHVALRVASINQTRAELEKHGVRFTEPEREAAGGGRVLFFADCDGNLLHLVERPAGGFI